MRLLALTLIALVTLHQQVIALDCIPIEFTQENVTAIDLIFEGKVLDVVKEADRTDLSNLNQDATYRFQINKIWKGEVEEETVIIQRNTYWGDGFRVGNSYLITATIDENGTYVAPLCDNSRPLEHAEEKIKKLETIFDNTRKDTPNE